MREEAGASFAQRIVEWQRRAGRHDLPWQGTRDAYRIWLSEIMLQQTQVGAAIPYYQRFLGMFPDVATLAAAPLDAVLGAWSGLGYYARARHLHRAARAVIDDHGGRFPTDAGTLAALPGVGRSTAAAIAVFAAGARAAILDGNVKRVLARWRGIEGWPGTPAVEKRLWAVADALLPATDVEAYTQGLMDLGSSVCGRGAPRCGVCPVREDCVARREARTAALPSPRPRRQVPERATSMLLCMHGGQVLLERRVESGIWGGLWSLPEFQADGDAADACRRLGLEVAAIERLPEVRHGFTHFSLAITPWRVTVARTTPAAAEMAGAWFGGADALAAGLPAPVRRLLLAEAGLSRA